MRKLFTLLAAVFASFSLWAADPVFKALSEAELDESGQYPVYTWSFAELKCKNVPNIYVQVPENANGTIAWACSSSNTGRFLYLYTMVNGALTKQSDRKIAMNTAFDKAGVKIEFTSDDIVVENETSYLVFGTSDDFKAKGIQLEVTSSGAPSTDPVLKVSKDTVDLFVTPSKANPSVQVTFSGKNLTPGNYSLTIPNLAGLTVAPQSVTVGEDGKLSAEVTISYTSAVDVATADVEISLTINEQVAKVAVNYGAMSAYCGELIRATHTGDKTADVTGLVGGSADKKTASDSKFGGKGQYFGITLADDVTFAEGDILNVHTTQAAEQGTLAIYADKAGATLLYNTGNWGELGDNLIELPEELDGASTLYICRTESNNWNGYVDYIAVTRDCSSEPKLAVSPASVKLKATADATSVSATVKFSGRNLAAGTYNLSLTSVAGLSADKSQVTVAADGKLSEDVVITYSSAVDVELGQAELSLTIGEKNAKVAIDYVAKISKQYANSINIEQFVLDNGKSADIRAALDAANIEFENIDGIDSLNASKDYNNYPFLGLKLKKEDAQLGFWLKQGSYMNLKFGNIGADFNVYIGDAVMPLDTSFVNKQPTDSSVVSCEPVVQDTYVTIVCGSTKTLVIKQIMIDEDIQPVDVSGGVDPTKDSDATIKSLSINGEAITRDGFTFAYEVPADVDLAAVEVVYVLNSDKATGNPESGFMVDVPAAGAPANEQTLIVTAESGAEMEYVISVTRAASPEEGLFDLDTTVPATKLLRNGQLLIIKNNRTFTVLGQEL